MGLSHRRGQVVEEGLPVGYGGEEVKPRLIKIRHAWHCGIKKWKYYQIIGVGFGPREAYDDWKAKNYG